MDGTLKANDLSIQDLTIRCENTIKKEVISQDFKYCIVVKIIVLNSYVLKIIKHGDSLKHENAFLYMFSIFSTFFSSETFMIAATKARIRSMTYEYGVWLQISKRDTPERKVQIS